jgi:FAD synthetase
MKIVMAFGTFDIFHPGHESYLKQARESGDKLIVVVARDKTVESIKKKAASNKERTRKDILEKSNLADEVILGSLRDKYAVIKKYKPDVIALGYDQKVDIEELEDVAKKYKTKIVRLEAYKPEIYKSSKLRN